MTIDILDIGVGNSRSVDYALRRLGLPSNLVQKTSDLSSETLIIPGVGSAKYFMEKVNESDFRQCLIDYAASGKRIIGICLGFQLLGQHSDEDGGVEGLGILSGFTEKIGADGSHNGWEPFRFDKTNLKKRGHRAITRKRVLNGRVFYNHEYGYVNRDDCYDQKIPGHLGAYSSILIKDNVIGIQFHPEKSQSTGLDLFSMIL